MAAARQFVGAMAGALSVGTLCHTVLPAYSAGRLESSAVYVSPTGSDNNTGSSPGSPLKTFEHAELAARASLSKTIYLMAGTYHRTHAFIIPPDGEGEIWRALPGQNPVLDGGGNTAVGVVLQASRITFRSITFRNFTANGIIITGGQSNVWLDSNTVENTSSKAFTRAAIITLGCSQCRITNNVIEHSGYAGIWVGVGDGTRNNNNLRVEGNIIRDSCRNVGDCGAIYVTDRNHTNETRSSSTIGIQIHNNVVTDFFHNDASGGKAIYLDDMASNVLVTSNLVAGAGNYAFTIHGGDHNVFSSNIFDLTRIGALASYASQPKFWSGGVQMKGNMFTCNIVFSRAGALRRLWSGYHPGAEPLVSHNLYAGVLGASKPEITDFAETSPSVGDPGFVNSAVGNYRFRGSLPRLGCALIPIDLNHVGVLANIG